MTKNQEYYQKMAKKVLFDCNCEQDFIDALVEIEEYEKAHKVEKWEVNVFKQTGAGELLMNATLPFRRKRKERNGEDGI